jgi:hypothetical protein
MNERDFFWVSMVGIGTLIGCTAAAIVIGITEHSDAKTQTAETYTWEVQQVRVDSCEYIIGKGYDRFGVYAITHKANCDNHGSKP